MNTKRSISEKNEILIDTTFLLPALGINVEKEAMEAIKYFHKVKVYYLEEGLLEAMWKILKMITEEKIRRVIIGIEAIRKTYTLLIPPPKAFIDAIKIYYKGHKDYIDAIHYTTALHKQKLFLTIDYEFIDFLKKNNYKVNNVIITPNEFISSLSY